MCGALIDTQTDFPTSESRAERYELRRRAGALLDRANGLADGEEGGRVSRCGVKRNSATVEVWVNPEGGAHFRGVETCGSIWRCAVCASKIAHRRTGEVTELCNSHMEAGGGLYMATLTLRHSHFDHAAGLRSQVTRAWEKAQQGGAWVRLKADLGIIGTVRALEVTHGSNGWHPHLHVLFFSGAKLSDDALASFTERLWGRWASAVERVGGTCQRGAFHMREASTGQAGAQYVAKWGAGQEIAKGSHKDASGQSVWDLVKASEHDAKAGLRFVEYALAFKGARHLTYARGLREWYGLRDAKPDEELALEGYDDGEVIDKETGEIITRQTGRVAMFDGGTWNRIIRKGLMADVLTAAAADGSEGVESLLEANDCCSYHDVREHPAPNWKPPAQPWRRVLDPATGANSFSELSDWLAASL